ncbi:MULTISPECIES: LysR family transcriptional regulator [unclassified Streptomyces]|uniref:LysR family transcriptional regulator n=1 Tax=unclassified Streptomyces TaxID=2593676 RepID=UPI001BEB7A1F|nr:MULTISPECIES: LysR family transcriptional regulator [unclassified Streptomyces]MBT2402768.1 LysR family transcriptional regulator [Streptomyces sp. ISL-21]MBT2607274.1 LysR family transcriptional regulator [Streptomyces sp. ISL-87]
MDLALLRTFVAVHRAGSFTRAAAFLGLSQPAVTSQIRTLERQLGRPLFHRRARGVIPTAVGDELAHKAAPHLDALLQIAETEREAAGALRTLHVAGPPEFLCLRVLPALAPLVGQGQTLRTALRADAEETLDELAAGRHDLVVTNARPRGGLFAATALCDEEHVLVAAHYWAALVGSDRLRDKDPAALDGIPLVEVHESLPLVTRYWAAVFETRCSRRSGHPCAFQKRNSGPLFSHDRTSRRQTHRPRDPARR